LRFLKRTKLYTKLQAIAAQVTYHRPLKICSLYLPPNITVTSDELESIVRQLPSPLLFLGDFNAHNPMWGSTSTNDKGNITEKLIDNFQPCILNNLSPTYLHPDTGTFSCIDFSIFHSTIYLDLIGKF
jgi:hypothetical protein